MGIWGAGAARALPLVPIRRTTVALATEIGTLSVLNNLASLRGVAVSAFVGATPVRTLHALVGVRLFLVGVRLFLVFLGLFFLAARRCTTYRAISGRSVRRSACFVPGCSTAIASPAGERAMSVRDRFSTLSRVPGLTLLTGVGTSWGCALRHRDGGGASRTPRAIYVATLRCDREVESAIALRYGKHHRGTRLLRRGFSPLDAPEMAYFPVRERLPTLAPGWGGEALWGQTGIRTWLPFTHFFHFIVFFFLHLVIRYPVLLVVRLPLRLAPNLKTRRQQGFFTPAGGARIGGTNIWMTKFSVMTKTYTTGSGDRPTTEN